MEKCLNIIFALEILLMSCISLIAMKIHSLMNEILTYNNI